MQIVLGSKNKAKQKAVNEVFKADVIYTMDAPSDVSAQPFSDQETLTGAINRSKYARNTLENGIGIGLEGGIMEIEGQLFLTNWGALTDESHHTYVASGARVPLPPSIAQTLKPGVELGDVMANFTKDKQIRHHQGAIGIFTHGLITRDTMFEHVLLQLKGQYLAQLIK
jgi:inosine/xanthosine triphosphatase